MITDAVFLVVGLVAGTVHFALLRWNAVLYTGVGPLWMAVAWQVLRLGVLAGVLTAVALQGAMPLLLTALGLLIARPFVMRRMAAI